MIMHKQKCTEWVSLGEQRAFSTKMQNMHIKVSPKHHLKGKISRREP